MTSAGEGASLSFEQDIRPSSATTDRGSMMAASDLFDYTNVVEHADPLVGSLRSSQMPCPGARPHADVDKLRQWIDAGKLG